MSKVCAMCGMACGPADYHPYAACLMFMACHDSETVRANLAAVLAAGEATRPAPNATDRPVQAAQTAAQEWAETDVFFLIGVAFGPYLAGQTEVPASLLKIAGQISAAIGDRSMVRRCEELVSQLAAAPKEAP